jgi:hypothetical protein
MARMEYFILNDVDLSFKDILKRSLSGEPLLDKKELEEWEQQRARRRDDDHAADEKAKAAIAGKKKKGRKGRRTDEDNNGSHHEDENGEAMEAAGEEDEEAERPTAAAMTDKPSAAEKAKAVERAAILAPQLNLQQIEAAIAKGGGAYDQDMINDLMAQTYAASVRWPKDRVLHVRLQHIVAGMEEGRWPVPPHSLLLLEQQSEDSGAATPEPANGNHAAARDTSTPLSEVRSLYF